MMRIARSFVFGIAALVLATLPAHAQWQVSNHAVPIGQGPGFTGFRSAAPSTSGGLLMSNGASSDPSFATTLTGNLTFAPTTGDALTVNTAANTIARGLSINQTGPLTGSTTASTPTNCSGGNPFLAYNYTCVNIEGANLTGASPTYYTFGSLVGLITGGANSTGTKIAQQVTIFHSGDSNAVVPRDTIGLNIFAISQNTEGGTNTSTGSNGSLYGMGCSNVISATATNYFVVSCGEDDVGIAGSATARYRFGRSIIGGGTTLGAEADIGLEISGASFGFTCAICITNLHGSFGTQTTGTLFGIVGSGTADKGIDFVGATLSTYIIRGPTAPASTTQFTVDSNANITGSNLVLGSATTGNTGTISLKGLTSGTIVLAPQAAAGTPTVTFGTNTGTPAVTASGPLAITIATGNITCATCTTSAASLTANQLVIGSGSQGEQSLGSLGTTTTVLHGNAGGAPTFSAVSLTADITGTLAAANGGTGLSTYAVGDLIYASATTPTLSKLAAVASGSILASAGTSTAPAWSSSPSLTGTVTAASFAVSQNTSANVSAGSFRNSSNGTAALVTFTLGNDTTASAALVGMAGSGYTNLPLLQNRLFLDASAATSGIVLNTETTVPIVMGYNNAEVCRFQTGLSCGTTTDAGSGAMRATGAVRSDTGFNVNGTAGVGTTCTITAGNTYVFTGGILTTKGANCT